MAESRSNLQVKGIAASEGIVAGRVYLISRQRTAIPRRRISEDQVPVEMERIRKAVRDSVAELEEIKKELGSHMSREPFFIIDVHLLLIQDESLWHEVETLIEEEMINAEWALRKVIDRWVKVFDALKDQYLRERGQDIDVVGERMLAKLVGEQEKDFSRIQDPVIVVSQDLRPDQTAQMMFSKILGFATDIGSSTSHTAIVARSLEIPAVVGLERITEQVEDGDYMILDGIDGHVIINPDPELCAVYTKKKAHWIAVNKLMEQFSTPPSITQDMKQVVLSANLEILSEINFLKKYGAEGVGLNRTEYLYMQRSELPGEDEHFENYRKLAEAVHPEQAVIRTFDLGGDKFASELKMAPEMNPALGLRAIRFGLHSPEIFKTQIRGILRASAFGKIAVMFPMISGLEEVLEAKRILKETMEELDRKGVKFNPKIPVGIMIEVPGAALTAERLAGEVEFFSIGTNDLIQYVLAIDRVNEYVSYLYQPLHPAVLKILKQIVDAGHKAGIRVAMCGEMANDAFYLPVLVGMGFDQLSMPARMIPMVRKVLRGLKAAEMGAMTEELMKLSTAGEVKRFLSEHIEKEWKPAYHLDLSEIADPGNGMECREPDGGK
jgi:phosphoenolpyruvate-protein phosphotransferase (PTS system enzyme I)